MTKHFGLDLELKFEFNLASFRSVLAYFGSFLFLTEGFATENFVISAKFHESRLSEIDDKCLVIWSLTKLCDQLGAYYY